MTGIQQMKMDFLRTNFSEDPNLGLYGLASANYCIIGLKIKSKKIKEIEETLGVDVLQTKIDGTESAGIFLAGNDEFLLVPASIKEHEKERLKELPVDIIEIETELNAFGNNLIIGKDTIVVNPRFNKKVVEKIRKETGYKVVKHGINKTGIIGANAIILKEKGLMNPNVSEKELRKLGKILKVEFDYGTVNFGSGFLRSGLVFNENGVVIGERSTGPEIDRIFEQFEENGR